ncbi:MAG: tRNA pseudouridine(38-40) synthase TruA [Acidimicrobiia bacterium]
MTLFDEEGGSSGGSTGDAPARCKLVVAYDGTDFRGYAAQPDVRTVEGVLAEALEKVLRRPATHLTCAGRTDAGVHAWGQVVSFDADADAGIAPDRLRSSLNGMLAPELVVRSVELAEPDFDARRSAQWRTYTYAVVNRPAPDPFLARYAWWVPEPLDLPALRLGADPFVGEHDFAAFCRKGPEGSTSTRRVLSSRWVAAEDGVLRYEISATAFCWQMVRSIVGTLVDVGTGRIRPGDLLRIVRARDRAAAGRLAPPQGLCLWEVGY